jgi:hypothetical protein
VAHLGDVFREVKLRGVVGDLGRAGGGSVKGLHEPPPVLGCGHPSHVRRLRGAAPLDGNHDESGRDRVVQRHQQQQPNLLGPRLPAP